MKTLSEKTKDIFDIINSEKSKFAKTSELAEYISKLELDAFDRGNDAMLKAAIETIKK